MLSAEKREEIRNSFRSTNSYSATAKACGLNKVTVRNVILSKTAHERLEEDEAAPPTALELPEFPDDDLPISEVIEHLSKRYEKRAASYRAHTWFPIKVNANKPIGLLLVGDPHLDDNGANWPLLNEHAKIARETPGLFAINIGDSTNNWVGRLSRLYANQDTSVKTARRLVEWFMLDSGIRWLLWLYGNHDAWGDGTAILAQMAKRYSTTTMVTHDWEARFSLDFPNKTRIRCYVAHDLPGNSMWNPLHAQVKASRFGKDIDLVVSGHRHEWALSQTELADQGTTPLLVRVSSYKRLDDYAKVLGKIEQTEGAAVLVVIDPLSASRAGRLLAFVDVAKGADYLTWIRSKK